MGDDRRQRWYEKHKDEVLSKRRQSQLGSGDKHLTGLQKRPHPGACELCQVQDKRLSYQHWDDGNPSLGMWLCGRCFKIAQGVEAQVREEDIAMAYQALKVKLSEEV
jgi:hypothetical protein